MLWRLSCKCDGDKSFANVAGVDSRYDLASYAIYRYTADYGASPVDLSAGTYWMSIYQDVSDGLSRYWATSAQTGGDRNDRDLTGSDDWTQHGAVGVAYYLSGSIGGGGGGDPVPEAGTCILFTIGILLIGTRLRRRQ